MVEFLRTNFFGEILEKLLKFLPISAKIVAPPNNLVQNDARRPF